MLFDNFLIWFVVVPVIMLAGLGVCTNRSMNAIRAVMVVGSTVLLAMSIWLCVDFLNLRAAGDTSEMLFTGSWMWYAPLNIHLAVGVDGISVLMLMLSSIIVLPEHSHHGKSIRFPRISSSGLHCFQPVCSDSLSR